MSTSVLRSSHDLSYENLFSTTSLKRMQEDEKSELSRSKNVICAICNNLFDSMLQFSNKDAVLDDKFYSKICHQCFVKEKSYREPSEIGDGSHRIPINNLVDVNEPNQARERQETGCRDFLFQEIWCRAIPWVTVGMGMGIGLGIVIWSSLPSGC